ncbi:MAG TPA: Gfo/Idh/MocA family oxidoreductase [Alphaproteobacteria bacterium]
MVIRVGMIGLSDGNGHPFSFSAITNGYDDQAMADSGWPVIYDYLKVRTPDEFGFGDVQITHAWTQDPALTGKLCAAAKIENAVADARDMKDHVDAVIIARDDWEAHAPLAKPFLDHGLPVFIDKPLTLDPHELDYFSMFLESGKLMSCSGLRHAKELIPVRDAFESLGQIKCIDTVVLIDWVRYGVHMLDAAFSVTSARPISVGRNPAHHDSFTVAMDDGSTLNIDAIGVGPKTFHLSFFGDKGRITADLHDNFSAFRATLEQFFTMVRSGVPTVPPSDTVIIMKTLMAGLKAEAGGAHVRL